METYLDRSIIFQIGIKAILPQLFKDRADGIYMTLTLILGINMGVIEADNDQNIKLLSKDLINEIWETSSSV